MSGQLQDVEGFCGRCQAATLQIGLAIEQTFVAGIPDFPGQTDSLGQTISPGGPGKLIHVIKCKSCGASWRFADEPASSSTAVQSGGEPEKEDRRYRDIAEWDSEGAFMSWLHRAKESDFPFWLRDGNSSFHIRKEHRESLVRGIMIGMCWSTRIGDEEE